MADVLARARALYDDAHRAEEVGRFDEARAGFEASLSLLANGVPDGASRSAAALRVRAMLGVARARYEGEGDLQGAMEALAVAEREALADQLVIEQAAVRGQRGLLHLRSGDPDAALVAFDGVDPGPGAPPTRDLAVTLLNRGALLLDRDPDGAARDLRAAAEVAAGAGEPNLEAAAWHNLGWLRFLQGDLPSALREMAEAAAVGQIPEPVALLDRARVLADAGLVSDAVQTLEQAITALDGGSVVVRAEVELALATCLLDLQLHERAIAAARASAAAFAGAGNEPWAVRATVVELEAHLSADRYTRLRAPVATLRERAEQALRLAERGETGDVVDRLVVVYPALLAAAEWSALAGDLESARAHLSRVPTDLSTAPLALQVNRSAVLARVAFASGDRPAGVKAVEHGQAALSAYRGLGSVEAVAASGVHALQLNLVDTEAALATGDATALFDALERGRAAAAGAARLVPPDDEQLARLLERARAEHQAALALGPTADPEGIYRKRQHLARARRFQAEARERSWLIEGERRPVRPTSAEELRAVLRRAGGDGQAAVVASFVTMGGAVRAVRVDADGLTMHRLAGRDEVMELSRRARADLAVVANTLIPAPLRESAQGSLARTLAHLDEMLLAPLDATGDLHVVARGHLLTLPWASLASRVGLRTWVGDRVDLRPEASRPGGVVVVAGPDTDGGAAEAAAVADVWPEACLLTGPHATTAATTTALRDAAVVHIAAHGAHVADNALFSTLRLADGPLFAHELDGVDLTGAVVVLSACELGQTTANVGGEELGFASVLLRHGARAVIAAVSPLRDDVAVRVMPRLHRGLRDGLRPGAALAAAGVDEAVPVPLVCFGPMNV